MARILSLSIVALWLFLAVPREGMATFYWIVPSGNNGNPCSAVDSTSLSTDPGVYRQTISGGIACMSGGDTLVLKAGIYPNQTIQALPAGTDAAYTVVRNAPGARPIISATGSFVRGVQMSFASSHHWEVRGLDFSGTAGSALLFECVEMFGTDPSDHPHHLRFIDNKCHDTVNVGILWYGNAAGTAGTDHYIAQNEFYNIGIGSPGYPPGMNTIYGTGSRTILEDNIFHNVVNGIAIWTAGYIMNDVIVRRNICYDLFRPSIDTWQQNGASGGSCIAHTANGSGTLIYNNIVYRSGETADSAAIYIANGNSNIKVFHNTIYNMLHAGAEAVDASSSTNLQCRNNIARITNGFVGCTTQSNNLTVDPLFVNAPGGDFHLQSGSAARGAAFDTLADVPDDFDLVSRSPAPADIGAFEFVTGGDTTPPAAPTGLQVVSAAFTALLTSLWEGSLMLHTLFGIAACLSVGLTIWKARAQMLRYAKRAYLLLLRVVFQINPSEENRLTVAGALEEAEAILRDQPQHIRS